MLRNFLVIGEMFYKGRSWGEWYVTVIALWLGHESTTTTHRYVEANLEMKQKALERLDEPSIEMNRYRPQNDELMQFLQTL